MKDWEDCRQFAKLKYGLDIDRGLAEHILEKSDNELLNVGMSLWGFKTYGYLPGHPSSNQSEPKNDSTRTGDARYERDALACRPYAPEYARDGGMVA